MEINGFQCDACMRLTQRDIHHSSMGLPCEWLILGFGGDLRSSLTFCSLACLHDWVEKQLDVPEVARPFHSSEIRRFLLVDKGPNADFTEGVKWPSGYVSVDPEKTKMHEPWCYTGWEEFKQAYPDRTVHWVDREDKPS